MAEGMGGKIESISQVDRNEQAEKLVGFLHKTKAFEYFQGLRDNPEKAEDVNFEDLRDFIVRLNGMARDIPIAEREPDGEKVYLEGIVDTHLVPKQEDKEGLLKEAFEARLKLKNPDDVSYMLPAVINAVHLFADGNGRTSRVINILLTRHDSVEDFEKKLRDALGESGRYESLDVNTGHLNLEIEKVVFIRNGIECDEDGMPKLPDDFNRTFTLEEAESEKAKQFWEKLRKSSYLFIF